MPLRTSFINVMNCRVRCFFFCHKLAVNESRADAGGPTAPIR